MPESKLGPEEPTDQEKRDGVPRWIKVTAAIIGIVATAAGVFFGGLTLVHEYEHEITEQAHAKATQTGEETKAEAQRNAGLVLKQQIEQAELKSQQAERDKQIQIEKEKTLQAQSALEAQRLESDRQVRLEQKDAANRERDQRLQEQKALTDAVANLEASGTSSLAAILTLSRYADGNNENKDLVIRALTTHMERACNAGGLAGIGESRLVFDILRRAGIEAVPQLIQLNRTAVLRFSDLLTSHLLAVAQGKIAASVKGPLVSDCKAARITAGRNDIIPFEVQIDLFNGYWDLLGNFHSSTESVEEVRSVDKIESQLACYAEVLASSSEILVRAYRKPDDMRNMITDLDGVYLDFRKAPESNFLRKIFAPKEFIFTGPLRGDYPPSGIFFKACPEIFPGLP